MVDDAPLLALLGPTNTGKTHRAVERMLEHATGMIGLPLRLLAREIYDRVSARVGEGSVALITGEEKRVPPRPRYWVSTVEAMPIERAVDFLAVDEIQLSAHRERGHVFTDRLLHARGRVETWFLGADTLRPMLTELLPTASVRRHPRLSRLRFAGSASLGQLPPRSAVVAFSMARVYEIAERLRRRRGGAAVVLGALSPRARNAQVAMYQAGEVEHLVATDAIGMGLNLDLDHVAFADLEKFDGKRPRPLEAAELAQIAGRAGRYQNDGTFGTLAPLTALPQRLVRSIEGHTFAAERTLVWRSSDLCFSSLGALLGSLKQPPPQGSFKLVEQADDFTALATLARDPEVAAHARHEDGVRLLWETCQIPDFRQLMPEGHARVVREVFLELAARGKVSGDCLTRHISRLDDAGGDIDALLGRMAFIRTWTYVSSHASWVDDPAHWQGLTRGIEDRLSDALHARLVERFVERARPSKLRPTPVTGPWANALERADRHGAFARLLAQLRPEPPGAEDEGWAAELGDAPHDRFVLDPRGAISADERTLGVLTRGVDLLRPEVKLTLSAEVSAGVRARLARRLVAFTRDLVAELFAPLRSDRALELSPAGRGLAYQLEQRLGTVLVSEAATQLGALTERDRDLLRDIGVVIGRRAVYLRSALDSESLAHRAAMWNAAAAARMTLPLAPSFPVARLSAADRAALLAVGYLTLGPRAARVDLADPPRGPRRRRRRKRRGRAAASAALPD